MPSPSLATRKSYVRTRLTAEEREQLRCEAERRGVSVMSLLRILALGAIREGERARSHAA